MHCMDCQSSSRETSSCAESVFPAGAFGIITISSPLKDSRFFRKLSRINLLSRFRCTASGTLRLATARPMRARPHPLGLAIARKNSVFLCSPWANVLRNCAELDSRMYLGRLCLRAVMSAREPMPTLAATRLEDTAATPGSHARPETVGAFPFDVAGLKCSFHTDAPERNRLRCDIWRARNSSLLWYQCTSRRNATCDTILPAWIRVELRYKLNTLDGIEWILPTRYETARNH